ncbi:MAG: S28 family serine protease [Kofleriaceae bacterium]
MRTVWILAALAACGGGDDDPGTDAPPGGIEDQLRALPGVTVTEEPPDNAPVGYRYFVLHVTQPVDHAVPGGPTFQQEVSLIHRDVAAPMVALTSGYEDFSRDAPSEPTLLLDANQISIEHRYFGSSRPEPADWSKLTIRQMADDEHAIVVLLKRIYQAPWINTGASKGGMTAVYHRRFYPEDVVGTLAYVAPLSFSIPDARYASNIDTVGTVECRTAIRALTTEMLQNRRAGLLSRAQAQATQQGLAYTRIAIGPALESAITDLEWTFWQYYGIAFCGTIPAVTATDQEMFAFLNDISGVSFSEDGTTAAFEAYFYQAYAQLGSPGLVSVRGDAFPPHLLPFRMFTEADFANTLPLGVPIPTHDPAAMMDIDTWVQTEGANLVFVYGEWDPWSGGKFQLGAAVDSLELINAEGTHGAGLGDLEPADREAALAKLAAWTGVTPSDSAPKHKRVYGRTRRLQIP